MMKIKHLVLLAGGLLLCAVFRPVFAGTIEAINHTKWAINKFSVNGQSGMDAIGPFQGGGGGCCYSAPAVWKPGMTVRVDWETGVAFASDVPEIPKPKRPVANGQSRKSWEQEWDNYYNNLKIWQRKIEAISKQHYRVVSLPSYTSSEKTAVSQFIFFPVIR